ncbi:MAG: hypothetical protein K0S61_3897 [Anaerocolumna sp.]|nr:hypothetical protein [Anaerocolumna sp.]
MAYCPYAYTASCPYSAMSSTSYIRVFHASPGAPNVDIYANGNLIAKDLAYKGFSPYLAVPAGSYNVQVFPTGQMTNPVINTNLNIPENTVFNIAAIGTLPNISLYPIQKPTTAQNFGRPCVRFVHLSPNAPSVDIKLSSGSTVFQNISYKGITDYVCVPSGTYTFTISPTGTNNVVLTIPNVKLDSNKYYTIYAMGLVGGSPALEALVAPEPR